MSAEPMTNRTIYLVWEEEIYEAPVLCGVYDNLAAAREHAARLKARDRREFKFSYRSYDVDRVRVGSECKRGITYWPRKQVIDPQPNARKQTREKR